MAVRSAALLAVLALAAGCGGGSDGGDDGASLGETLPPTPVTAPALPASSPAGSGVVVLAGSTRTFSVTTCRLEAEAADPSTLVLVTGAGTAANGIPFQVEIRRVAADSEAAETFTDVVTYTDTARILQIQRAEVEGEVTDLRDPDASGTLLQVRADGVAATGIAGPPGTGGEDSEGLFGMAVDATC
jgi:hypothetical protein